MKIKLISVFVDDQDKALKFYTEVLGFVKKTDMPAGVCKWLTVVSPEEPDGTELLLEPNSNPAARIYQKAIFEQVQIDHTEKSCRRILYIKHFNEAN
jgi:catechol 2,3-dioxygenase-like lactoylglutathione lyase family enzyme